MGENDYESGYRGNQFHHGMDRNAYEAGKAKKEEIDAIGRMAGGGQPVEVPGVAFTLLLVAPFLWMVYPVLGATVLIVPGVVVGICIALKAQGMLMFLLVFILGVASFFPGLKFEYRLSQFGIYRVIRGFLRIVFAFVFGAVLCAGKEYRSGMGPGDLPPQAWVGGFFIAVIAYLIFQRLDLLYFPSQKEMKKMTEKILRGDRITRPLGKRLLWGFCWFIPVMMILNLIVNIGVRLGIENQLQRKEFYTQFNVIIFCVNAGIWYVLCLLGKLPGTSKFRYTKQQEEGIKEILSQKNSA